MLPVPVAIAWTFWRQHRWGLLLQAAYLFAAGVTAAILPAYLTPPYVGVYGCLLTMPLLWAVLHLIGAFSYGLEADLNARHSCFPASLFTLPIRTGALAGWPLAYGAVSIVLLWLVTAGCILQPSLTLLNVTVPLWWPAMLGMAALAWVQAVLWSPFGLPALRVILAIIIICGVMVAAQVGILSGISEGVIAGMLATVAAAGWWVAYNGVRRARRGDVPNWDVLIRPFRRQAQRRSWQASPFASVARAQVWCEWRRTGRTLPFMTVLVLPFVLLPLLWGPNDVIPTARTLLGALGIPVVLAGIAGTVVSGKNPWVKDYYGVAPFTATLPMTTAGLVSAKLKAAALSTLVTWALLVGMVFPTVVLTGNLDEVAGWWRQAADQHGFVKVVAAIAAAAILLFVWTWKRIVDSLLLGLTGRKWVIQGAMFGFIAGLCMLAFFGGWIYRNPQTHETFFLLLPWALGLLVLSRLTAAAWALRRALRHGLLTAQTVFGWVAVWLLLVLTLFGLLAWIVPAELVPRHYLAYAVVSVFPLVHLAATPLALAWNRHR
jgi:hypothetical protein